MLIGYGFCEKQAWHNIMKSHTNILLTLLIISFFFGFASCTKKEQPATLFSDIVGTWKKTAYATDDNGSGIITASEKYPQPSYLLDVLVFKSDTTGKEYTVVNNVSD